MRRPSSGFTLVEILVAVVIAAILSAMVFSAMSEAMQNRDRVKETQARLVALQFAMRSLAQDFSQLAPRPVRAALGEGYEAAVVGQRGTVSQVVLTRAGWSNPAGVARSGLQRVRYEVREGVLYRDYWLTLDAQTEPQPVQRALLDGVEEFAIRYMSDGRQWQDNWPPPQQDSENQMRYLRWRPIAVEVTLRLRDWGTVTRIVEVAG